MPRSGDFSFEQYMENFDTLSATVAGGTVTLIWTNIQPGFPNVTAYAVQRTLFGRADGWVTLTSGLVPAASQTYDDSPGVGDWTYRIAATVTQGGIDNAGTTVYSNNVNVTTEAATGEVTLTLSSAQSSDQPSYTVVSLAWTIAGTAVDVRSYEVQRTLDGGAHWRTIHIENEFGNLTFAESLATGTGVVFYRVIAHLPSATPPYQADVLSTSNSVTVTL
jgi:hypothetical protein